MKIISDFQGLLIQVKGLTDELAPFGVVVCEVIQAGSQFRSILRDSWVVVYQRAANCQALKKGLLAFFVFLLAIREQAHIVIIPGEFTLVVWIVWILQAQVLENRCDIGIFRKGFLFALGILVDPG